MAGSEATVLVFRIADRRFALDASRVAEVIRPPAVTRVPHAPASLSGVSSVRGKVVPVVELARLLGMPAAEARDGRLILLEGAPPVGLAVDEIVGLQAGEARGLVMTEAGAAQAVALETLLAAEFASALGQRTVRRSLAAPAVVAQTGRTDLAFLGFMLAGQPYALALDHVREVTAAPADLAALPRTDEAMLGVVNLRGALSPVVSTRVLLGLPPAPLTDGSRMIVAAVEGARVGLAVDAVTAIIRAAPSAIGPAPELLNRGAGEARITAMLRTQGGGLISILEPERLFRDEDVGRILQDARAEVDEMAAQDKPGEHTERLLIFTLGDEAYGVDIAAVEEVVAMPETLTRLPKSPAYVLGVMNLRGEVIPVIDQRRRFEAPAQASARPRVMVVRLGELLAGFAVDGVSQILEVPASRLASTPELAPDANRMFDRTIQTEDGGRVILLVNPQELLQRAERDLLASLAAEAAPS